MAIAVIALIAIVFFMIVSPEVRVFVVISFLLVIGAFWWIVDSGKHQREVEQNEEAARQRRFKQIPESDLSLSNANFDGFDLYGNSEKMRIIGNVTNKSDRQLSSVVLTFEITIRDCPSEGASDCPIVGQHQTNSYGINLPAGQMRAFSTSELELK